MGIIGWVILKCLLQKSLFQIFLFSALFSSILKIGYDHNLIADIFISRNIFFEENRSA